MASLNLETEGFSHFTDSKKFKYNEYGEILISTDSSSWANKLLNNMKLDDYFESESLIPIIPTNFPNFESQKKIKKGKKESVGNLIEECDICNAPFENYAHRLINNTNNTYKLTCQICFKFAMNINICKVANCCNSVICHTKLMNNSNNKLKEIYLLSNVRYYKLCRNYCEYHVYFDFNLKWYERVYTTKDKLYDKLCDKLCQAYNNEQYDITIQQTQLSLLLQLYDDVDDYETDNEYILDWENLPVCNNQLDECIMCNIYNPGGGVCYYCQQEIYYQLDYTTEHKHDCEICEGYSAGSGICYFCRIDTSQPVPRHMRVCPQCDGDNPGGNLCYYCQIIA